MRRNRADRFALCGGTSAGHLPRIVLTGKTYNATKNPETFGPNTTRPSKKTEGSRTPKGGYKKMYKKATYTQTSKNVFFDLAVVSRFTIAHNPMIGPTTVFTLRSTLD